MRFKLPRKKKKAYLKSISCGIKSLYKDRNFRNYRLDFVSWEERTHPERSWVRAMSVVLGYPKYDVNTGKYEFDPNDARILSTKELIEWYKVNYPNNKRKQHYAAQNCNRYSKYLKHPQ